MEVTFAPLGRADFPRLSRWLAEPAVHRWWHQDSSSEAVEREFGPSLSADDPTEVFVVGLDGRPVGLVQRYPLAAYPEYVTELTPVVAVPTGAWSIDYLLGEPDVRGRGLAADVLAAFVAATWDVHPEAQHLLVPVSAGNPASWRALARAGFVRVAEGPLTPDNPVDPPDHVVYRLSRPAAR